MTPALLKLYQLGVIEFQIHIYIYWDWIRTNLYFQQMHWLYSGLSSKKTATKASKIETFQLKSELKIRRSRIALLRSMYAFSEYQNLPGGFLNYLNVAY